MPLLIKCLSCNRSFRVADSAAGQSGECVHCSKKVEFNGPVVSPFDVFVSYSSKDKAVADAAVGVMESRGIRCWIAPRDITAGQEWGDAIIQGIGQSRAMLLVFSGNANASQQVLREVERAVSRGLPIIPFRIENVMPSKAMEYYISASHWLDAYHPPLDSHLDTLASTVEMLLDGAPASVKEERKDLKGLVSRAARTLTARDNRVRVLLGLVTTLILVSATAVAAVLGLREAKATDGQIQSKANAESIAGDVAPYDRGQGFETLLQELDGELRKGQNYFDQKRFRQAETAFARVAELGATLRSRQNDRKQTLERQIEVEVARQKSQSVDAAKNIPKRWIELEARYQVARSAYDRGDFGSARELYESLAAQFAAAEKEAVAAREVGEARASMQTTLKKEYIAKLKSDSAEDWSKLEQAIAAAETLASGGEFLGAAEGLRQAREFAIQASRPRVKAELFELGRHMRLLYYSVWYDQLNERNRKISRNFPGSQNDVWPSIDRTSSIGALRRFRNQFDVGSVLLDQYLRETDISLMLHQIRDELPSQLATAGFDRESISSYHLACNIELNRAFFQTSQLELSLYGFNYPLDDNLLGLMEVAIVIGLPNDVVAKYLQLIESVATWREESRTKSVEFRRLAGELSQQLDAVHFDLLANPDLTCQTFRRHLQSKTPPPDQKELFDRLRSDRVVFYQDADASPAPLIRLIAVNDQKITNLPTLAIEIGKATTLQELWLTRQPINDAMVAQFKNLNALKTLILSSTQVTDAGLVHLKGLTQLEKLGLNSTTVSDEGLKVIATLPALKRLLLKNSKATDAGVAQLKKANPKLQIER